MGIPIPVISAIQILIDYELQAKVRELNMPLQKLPGLSAKFHRLTQKLETKAAELDTRINETDQRSDKVFGATSQHLDGFEQNLKDVNTFLDQLAATNSGVLPEVKP